MYEINGHRLLQYPGELEELVRVFRENEVKSYLEIGCKFGGSLWTIGTSLPKGSRIVAVDTMMYPEIARKLQAVVDALSKNGYKVQLIRGDSTDVNLIKLVAKHAPFDACFIDANHSMPYVSRDWTNYSPMCRLVAFHDINYSRTPEELKQLNPKVPPIEVPVFWNELKTKYKHLEIKHDKRDNGIGVIWP